MIKSTKKIFFNTSWIFTDNVVRLIINFIVSVWVARYLGPTFFGMLSYAIAVVSIFNIVANLGINDFVIKDFVNLKRKKNTIAGSTFFLKIIGAIISILAIIGFITLTQKNQPQMLIMVTLISAGFIFQSLDVIDLQYQSKVISKFSIWARNPAFMLASALKIYFILSKMPVSYFALAALIEVIIGTIGTVFIYYRLDNNIFKWKIDKKIVKSLFYSGFPILLSGTFTLIYLKTDRIVVGQILGQTALGNYSAATALTDPWIFVPAAIASSVFPAIITTKARDNNLYLSRIHRLYSFLLQLGFIVAIVTTVLSPYIINILYGQKYADAIPVLAIYIWSLVFIFADAGAIKWYLIEGLQRYLAYRAIAGTVLAIIMSYLLINKYGMVGGSISAVITQFFVIYLFNFFFSKTRILFKMQSRAIFDIFTFRNFKYIYNKIR